MSSSEFAPSGSKVLGGAVGGALLGWVVAGPGGAVAGGVLGLILGAAAEEKDKFL